MAVRQLHSLMLAVFCMAFVAGWICCGTTAVVRAWKGAAETYQVERDYYNNQADAIIAEAKIKINKEKKNATE